MFTSVLSMRGWEWANIYGEGERVFFLSHRVSSLSPRTHMNLMVLYNFCTVSSLATQHHD
jgi:hypothetical protein